MPPRAAHPTVRSRRPCYPSGVDPEPEPRAPDPAPPEASPALGDRRLLRIAATVYGVVTVFAFGLAFFTNQVRKKMGTMAFGNTYPGGDAQMFYSSVIVEMQRIGQSYFDNDKAQPVTARFKFNIVKNKTAKAFAQGEFDLALVDHPKGAYREGQFLDQVPVYEQAERFGIISDKWVCYGEKFKTKTELNAAYFQDEKNYAFMKNDIMKRLFPKQ